MRPAMLTLVWALILSAVQAEIYDYDLRIAQPKSLEISHSMSVSGTPDTPGDIEIHDDLRVISNSRSAGAQDTKASNIAGLHMIVLIADDVPRIDKDHFCCTEADVSGGACEKSTQMRNAIDLTTWNKDRWEKMKSDPKNPKQEFIYSVPLESFSKSVSLPIFESGLFYLGLVNCGTISYDDEKDGVSGRIFVRSSHGYLPAVDLPAMHFNQFLLGLYSIVFLTWLFLCFKWRKDLVSLHHFLTLLIAITWLATVSRYSVYSLSNISEVTVGPSEVIAELLQVTKFAAALCCGVAVSLGWGTVHDSLGSGNMMALTGLGGGYLAAACLRIMILWNYDVSAHLWYSGNGLIDHLGSLAALVILPEGVLFALLVSWARGGLKELENSLSQTRQAESLKTLSSFVCGVKLAMLFGVGLLVIQLLCEGHLEMSDRWSTIWVFDEGGPNAIFLFLMLTSLYLFMPCDNYKLKCTSQQLSLDEAELDEMVGVEMAGLETSKEAPEKFLE